MTVPGEVKLARHALDIDDDGHHAGVVPAPPGTDSAITVEPQAAQSRLYLMRDGTWRDPLVSGLGTVSTGSGATIVDDTKYNAWPTVARLTEDRLIVAYTKANGHHTDNSGHAIVRIGTEDGDGSVTWGSEIVAYSNVSLWSSAFGVSRISTGRIFLGLWRDQYGVSNTGEAGLTYSDDDGATWHAWIDLTNSFTQEAYTAGPVVEMPDGDLLVTIEGTNTGTSAINRSSHTLRSTDGGATWGGEVTIRNYVTDTRPYYETRLLLLDDDTLLAIHRCAANSPGTHYISTSTDFGLTWGTPAAAYDGYGASNVIQMSTGTLVAVTRENATGDVILFTSTDRGATWDAGTVLATTYEMEYGQAIELLNGRGELMVVYGDQPSSTTTNSDIKSIRVTEDTSDTGAGVSFATPAIVLGTTAAAGAAATAIRSDSTIVAFDATAPTTQAFGDSAATGSAAVAARRDHQHGMPAAPTSGTGPSHVHVAYETHTADGSTTTFTLDQVYDAGSVMAWNGTTGHVLGVTEVSPDQATISAAGTAGDLIDFHYAASII